MSARKRTIIMYKTELRKSIKLFARELELKHGATDVILLPLINGLSCFMPDKVSFSLLAADQEIDRIEDDIIISLPKPFEEGDINKRSWGFPAVKSDYDKQVIPHGVDRIGASNVWNISTGEAVRIGVLDTGIEGHLDLQGNLGKGINVIDSYVGPNDDNGHGTHIAGTIGAMDNRLGVVGVAPKAYIYPVKVLNYQGNGTLSSILAGLQWCIDNQIQVVNMSLGTSEDSEVFLKAIKSVYNAGIAMVAASGNDGLNGEIDYPAAYRETIAVGAITVNNTLAWYSNSGNRINLVAPGDRVLSTLGERSYGRLSGTSMATAHVTGVIALMLKLDSTLSPFQITNILANSAEKLRDLTTEQQGSGLVRADKAIEKLQRMNLT